MIVVKVQHRFRHLTPHVMGQHIDWPYFLVRSSYSSIVPIKKGVIVGAVERRRHLFSSISSFRLIGRVVSIDSFWTITEEHELGPFVLAKQQKICPHALNNAISTFRRVAAEPMEDTQDSKAMFSLIERLNAACYRGTIPARCFIQDDVHPQPTAIGSVALAHCRTTTRVGT